jgi:hypothetical protein
VNMIRWPGPYQPYTPAWVAGEHPCVLSVGAGRDDAHRAGMMQLMSVPSPAAALLLTRTVLS